MDKINEQRKYIDNIDNMIMELLDKRFIHTIKIGELKKQISKNVLDKKREQDIFDKTSKYSHSPQIINIYKTIMEESKNLQKKVK